MKTENRAYLSNEDAEYAAEVLKRGGLVVFPTETVYGLGALMSREEAVHKIYEIKGREENKPLSILIADSSRVGELADLSGLETKVARLAEAFWPGPLTLILPKKECVPDHVTAGKKTVGIRIPDHAFALALVKAVGEPVVTTSANLSGAAPAVTAEEATAQLAGSVELIVDGGQSLVKTASTVAGFSDGKITIFREGSITKEALTEVLEGKSRP